MEGVDFIALKRMAARRLKLLNRTTNTIVSDGDISEGELGELINEAYIEDSVPMLMEQVPNYYLRPAYMSNYYSTLTAISGTTGSTLKSANPDFNIGMIGTIVHNTTDDTTATITGYTSAYIVTTDSTSMLTWVGDTVKLLNKYLPITDDIGDIFTPRRVRVRYVTTLEDYHRATPIEENNHGDLNIDAYYSQLSPGYQWSTVLLNNVPIDAIRIYPKFSRSDSRAIEIWGQRDPHPLAADSSKPRLPRARYLYWYAVMVAATDRKDVELASLARDRYERGRARMLSSYRPESSDIPASLEAPAHLSDLYDRLY